MTMTRATSLTVRSVVRRGRLAAGWALTTLAVVACQGRDSAGSGPMPAPCVTPEAPAAAAHASKASVHVKGTVGDPASVPATDAIRADTSKLQPQSEPKPAAVRGADTTGLVVKRFVVASEVRDREPVTSAALPSDAPLVYAFAELQNRGAEPQRVRVTFERKGSTVSVGHAKLEVPAGTPRYRTWATSRHVHEPGTWYAVLWSEDGTELGRSEFEVTAAPIAAAGNG